MGDCKARLPLANILIERESIGRVVSSFDLYEASVIRAKAGPGQRVAVLAMPGEVEMDAAMLAKALRRSPAIARPCNVCRVISRIGPDTVQRIHPPRQIGDQRSKFAQWLKQRLALCGIADIDAGQRVNPLAPVLFRKILASQIACLGQVL